MSEAETQLLELLKTRSFRRGSFQLASGDTSDYYIDGKMVEVFSESAHLIGEVLYERTKDFSISGIGGLEVGAIPLTTAAVIAYHQHGMEMEGFWVRDQAKAHGTKKTIEGKLERGSRVVIVDDVITRGTSSLKAAKEVQRAGAEVVLVLALVDRLQAARELFESEHGLRFEAVFTIRDFGLQVEELPASGGRASR
jgi:orotate phosphoribosyltransferase